MSAKRTSDTIMRVGKTKRDRENNAHQRNAANKAARAEWDHNRDEQPFPLGSCNGKKSQALKNQ